MSAVLLVLIEILLRHALGQARHPTLHRRGRHVLPGVSRSGLQALSLSGGGPPDHPDRLTIWQAASAPESLLVIFWGVCVVLPAILGYTIYAYRVFGGKASELSYE